MFDYFYETQTKSFRFIKVPTVLLEEKEFEILTAEAILLYSIMLQRVTLSYKNRWIDEEGKIYIYYTIEEIKKTFGIHSEKSQKILKSLEAVGLIEKREQGLGKPNKIYVKNFMSIYQNNIQNTKNENDNIEK